MRWPWQPRPGMVRVKERDLIETLRAVIRAHELEDEIRETTSRSARIEAKTRALEVLAEGPQLAVGPLREELLAELPLTTDGRLHEVAFRALVHEQAEFDDDVRRLLTAEDGGTR